MGLWVPPSEQARQMEDRRQYLAGILQQRQLHSQIAEWNKLLRDIDSRLELVKAPDNARHPALRPGFWHVVRHEGAEVPPAIIVHEGPNGEYRDPDSSLLERLRKGDMWSSRSMKAMSDANKAAQRAAEKKQEQERADRIEQVMDLHRHRNIVKVAI